MESNDTHRQLRRNADGVQLGVSRFAGSVISRGGAGYGPHGCRIEIAAARTAWGVFRDRRPDLYAALNRLDGR